MPKILKLAPDGSNCKEIALEASEILRGGGVVLYPTETVYGLGCDACNEPALRKIYEIKARPEQKLPGLIVADQAMVERYALFLPNAELLARQFWPASLTLVLPKRSDGLPISFAGADEVSFRIPDHELCISISSELGNPIVATSANRAGEPTQPSIDAILQQLGSSIELIDIVIDGGILNSNMPSTVIDCTQEKPLVLREGAISKEAIYSILNS